MIRNYETSMTGDDNESPFNKSVKQTKNEDTVENLRDMEEVSNLIQMETPVIHGRNIQSNNRYETIQENNSRNNQILPRPQLSNQVVKKDLHINKIHIQNNYESKTIY